MLIKIRVVQHMIKFYFLSLKHSLVLLGNGPHSISIATSVFTTLYATDDQHEDEP